MPDPIKQYYEYLKKAGADVAPTFESFSSTLQDSKTAKTYYDYLKSNNFDTPETFESFQSTLGFGKIEPVKKKESEVTDQSPKEVSESQSPLSGEPAKVEPGKTEPQPTPPAPGPSATDFAFQLDESKKKLQEFNKKIIGKVDAGPGGALNYFAISDDPAIQKPMPQTKVGDIVDFTSVADNREARDLVNQMASLKRGQEEIADEKEKEQYEAYRRQLLALNEKNKDNPYYSQTGYKQATAEGWVDVDKPEEDFLAKNIDEVKIFSFDKKIDPKNVDIFYAGQNDPELNKIIDTYDIGEEGGQVKELLYRRKNIIPFLVQAYRDNKNELDTEEGRQRLLQTAIDKAYGVSDYAYNGFTYPGVDEKQYKENLNLFVNSKFYQQQGDLTAKAKDLKSKLNDIEDIAKTSTDPKVKQQYNSLVSQYNNVVNQFNTLKEEIKPITDYFERPENIELSKRLENQREGAELLSTLPRMFPTLQERYGDNVAKIIADTFGLNKVNLPGIGSFAHGLASGIMGVAGAGVQLAKTFGVPTGKALPYLDKYSKQIDYLIGDKTGIDNLPVEIINKVGGIFPYIIPYAGQVLFTAGSAGTQMMEAKRAGVTNDADLFTTGVVTALVNKYAGKLLPDGGKSFKSFTPSRQALGLFLNPETRVEGAKLISKQAVSELNKQYLKNVGEGALHGVGALKIMETGSAITNSLLNRSYGTDLGTEVDMTFNGMAKELLTMGIISGVTSAGGYLDRRGNYRPEAVKTYALTKAASDYPFALKYIENLKKMPNADMEAIQNTENAIAKIRGTNFPDNMTVEQKVATFNVIDNINTLKEQKAKADPEFHEAIDNQIKELENKKQEYINNPELAKSEVESQMKPLMDDAVLKAQEYATTESKQQEGPEQGNRVQPTRAEDGQPKEGEGERSQGQGPVTTADAGDSNISSQGQIKDVESTTKALQGKSNEELSNAAPGVFKMGRGTLAQQVAEAYHKAADGSNPELRRAVNKLLGIERPKTMEEAMQRLTPEQRQMYLDKVVEGDDQGANAILDIAPEAPKVYTAENVETITTEGLNETQAKVLGDAKTVLPSIGGIVKESTGNDATLNVHKDDASFGEAVVSAGGSRQDATSKGFYLDSNGNIHLNMQRVTTDTMLHEAFHPLLDFIQKNAPEKIQELYNQLRSIDGVSDLIARNERLYKNQGVTQVMKESITDFFAQVRDGKYNINASNFEKIKNFVYEVLNKIGLGPQAQKILNMKDAKELKDLINTIGERFETGKQVTAEDLSTVNMSKEAVEKLQFAKEEDIEEQDDTKFEEKDYKEAEKINKENKKELSKFPEAIAPVVQRDKSGKIKISVKKNKKGQRIVTPLYSTVSYNLENGAQKYISKNKEKSIEKLSDKLVDDYNLNKDKPEISAAIGWYGNMREWFQKNFGANIELFGQLLAATSARTDVISNFEQAVEAMKNLSKGSYDELLKDYDSFVKDIKSRTDEQLFEQWKERYPKKRKSEFDPQDFRTLLINSYENVPLKSNGKKYNANSKKVLQALYGNWIEQTEGPKTKNFAGNLTGRSFDATIDVWAARYLRRIIYSDNLSKWRIVPESEGSVDYNILKSGEMTGDYPFAEAVMRKAAEKIGIKADDLQAFLWYLEKDVWDKNGWTNKTGKKKASFEEGASTLDTERYQAAVTTYKDDATFDPIKFEQERKDIQRIIGEIPGIIVSRVTPSEGEFYSKDGIYTEPTFDVEFTVDKGTDIQSVINKVSEIQNIYNQDAIIISKFVDENATNARPIIEIGLSKPIEKSEIIDDIKAILADMNVRGFTTAKDSRGRILGIRSQFVPEFEQGVTIKEGGERFAAAFEKIKNKYGENPEISYISTSAVDSQVKFNENETRTQRTDEGSTTEQGIQGELRQPQPGEQQGIGNRAEEKATEGERLADQGKPGEDGGVVPKPENGNLSFSRAESTSRVQDLFDKGLISKSEYDESISKIEKLYPPPTSIKNKTVDEERALRGQEPIEKMAKESFGDWYDEAKFNVNNGYSNPRTLAKEIVDNPRATTPVESATLLYGRMQLNNERARALQNLERANESGDQKKISEMMFNLRQIETEIEMNDLADSRSGSMAGKALVARKMMLADDYSLTNVERRMKAANGGKPLDPELVKKITSLTEEIRIKDEKLKELEARQMADPISTVIDNFKPKPGAPKQPKAQERKNAILDKIRAKMNKGGLEMARSERPNPLEEYEREIAELAKYYVEEGITDPIELVQKVREDVNELIEGGAEERDVQDVISGYGKRTFLSQDEVAKQMRDIKQQLKLFSALEDVSEGRLPEKSGLQREEPSDEVRRLRQELNDAIKNSGLDEINKDAETQYKTALDAVKKRLSNQIKDLENQIATGERRQKKEGIEYDQEAIDLRNERDRLRGIIDDIDGKEGMSAEQRLRMANASLQRAIDDLERRIAEKDFSKREKKPLQGSEYEMNTNELLKFTLNLFREDYKKLKDQEGITEKERLDRYKKNLQKRLSEYETKLANKDFAPKPKKQPVVDEEVNKLKKEIAGVKFKIDEEKANLEWQNKSKFGKAVTMVNEIRRGILLSSMVTLGKIGTAGTYIMAAKPLESIAGSVISKLPWMREIAKKAPREGQVFNPKAELEAVTQLFKEMSINDLKNIMAGKPTEFEALYGDKTFTENEKSFLKYFGRSHAAIKYFPKTGEIYRSFRYRANDALKKGEDIKDPIVYSRLMAEAILDGKREIFMGDNSIVDGYKSFIRSLESRDNLGSNITSGIFNFLLPIVKVPTNYVKSTGEYLAGTANAIYKISRKGIDSLEPQEADMVMRLFKKNLIGAGFLALGYLNPNNIGGYYTGKRDEKDLEAMDIEAFGVKIPHWATHHPLMEVMQFGSTLRRLHDAEIKSGEEAGSMPTLGNVGTAGAKLIEEVPFLSTIGDVSESLKSDYKARNFMGNLAASLIPPDVKRIAKMRDVDETGEPIKRRTTTVMEKVMSNIPGMREKLPQDPAEKKRVAREKIKSLLTEGGYEYYSDIKDEFPEVVEAADISNIKTFKKSLEMDKDVYKFYNNDADKQIKRWSALTEREKEDYSEFLGTRASFEKAVKNKPELLKEPRWKKAYEQILEIVEE